MYHLLFGLLSSVVERGCHKNWNVGRAERHRTDSGLALLPHPYIHITDTHARTYDAALHVQGLSKSQALSQARAGAVMLPAAAADDAALLLPGRGDLRHAASAASSSSFQPDSSGAMALASVATAISLSISLFCIYKHLTNYSVPRYWKRKGGREGGSNN